MLLSEKLLNEYSTKYRIQKPVTKKIILTLLSDIINPCDFLILYGPNFSNFFVPSWADPLDTPPSEAKYETEFLGLAFKVH